jgi:glycosyltransferase involved in cell wall biosynthesis
MFAGKKNIILDMNFINATGLGLYIREKTGAKVLTRMQIMAWHYWTTFLQGSTQKLHYLLNKPYCEEHLLIPHEREAYADVNQVVCVAPTGAEFVKGTVGADAIVANNGIIDVFNGKKTYKKYTPNTEFTAIAIGQISIAPKGIWWTAEAMEKVAARGYNVKLVVCGWVSDADKERAAREMPHLKIEFTGTVQQEELHKKYDEADIGIISSTTEQCNMTGLEMMMHALPVCISDIKCVSEIFTEDAALFTPTKNTLNGWEYDTDTLANNIIKLIESQELREKMGKRARALYEEKYTEKIMIENTLRVYEKMIDGE